MKERNPDIVNPGWKRPESWKYEEDWNSPCWRRRMAAVDKQITENRDKYGFIECPKCHIQHTTKTLCCRGCGYKKKKTK